MKEYLIVAIINNSELQKWIRAESAKSATKIFWKLLDDHQQNNTESIECIDER